MGDDLVDLMAKPQAMMENAITNLTKKTATSLWSNFKRLLATGSDILFRKDMGERYFTLESMFGGIILWTIGTLASLFLHISGSFFHTVDTEGILLLGCLGTGAALVLFQFVWGDENIKKIARYRADGLAYHTRSRGVSRWGALTIPVVIGVLLVLFIFNFVSMVFLIASMLMSAKLAREQDAAIYGRYLDALDAQIEKEYLEKAILGKCPTEITQLHKPLPANMKQELRENIAAAAVGKPVKIVSGRTERGGAPTQFPPEEVGSQAGGSQEAFKSPRAGAKSAESDQPQPEQQPADTASGNPPAGTPTSKPRPSMKSAQAKPQPPAQPPEETQSNDAQEKAKAFQTMFPLATGVHSPELHELISRAWEFPAFRKLAINTAIFNGGRKISEDELISLALTTNYESREYGENPPPRSETKIGERDGKDFAPEVLDLFQKTLDAGRFAELVSAKATAPETLPADAALIREALTAGHKNGTLAGIFGD